MENHPLDESPVPHHDWTVYGDPRCPHFPVMLPHFSTQCTDRVRILPVAFRTGPSFTGNRKFPQHRSPRSSHHDRPCIRVCGKRPTVVATQPQKPGMLVEHCDITLHLIECFPFGSGISEDSPNDTFSDLLVCFPPNRSEEIRRFEKPADSIVPFIRWTLSHGKSLRPEHGSCEPTSDLSREPIIILTRNHAVGAISKVNASTADTPPCRRASQV